MANNLDSNVSSIVLKKFAPMFQSDSVLMNTVDRQLIQGEINPNTGDTVFLKRPHQYKSLRTASGDISGSSKSPIISGKVPAKISNYCTVAVEYSQIEEAIKLNQLDEILRPISARIQTDIETELAKFILDNGALSLGTAGTSVSKWGDVAQCGSMLKDLGVVGGENYAVLDPWAAQDLANAQAGLAGNDSLIATAWERAQIPGNFAGLRALMSNGLASRTAGSGAGAAAVTVKTKPTVTYNTVKDTYQMTVVLTSTNFASKNLKAGDQVQFDTVHWVNQQSKQTLYKNGAALKFTATVTADATASGNDITVVLSGPAIKEADGAYNTVSKEIEAGDAVTVIGTADTEYKPNLFYNSMAIAMGTVELPKLHSKESSVMSSPQGGLSIRVHKYSDGDKNIQMMRFDVLPAFAILNPLMCGQFHGNP